MAERQHPHYEDIDIINVDTHHEKTDVNVRALLWTVAATLIIGVISWVGLWYMFRFLEARQKKEVRNATPLTSMQRPADADVPKNQPLLQPFPHKDLPPYGDTPVDDLQQMRLNETTALSSYSWVDEQKGVVRIPIEEAKKIALQRGFPVAGVVPPSGRPSEGRPEAGTTRGTP